MENRTKLLKKIVLKFGPLLKNTLINNYDQISTIVSSILSILLSMLASFFYAKLSDSNNQTSESIYVEITLCFFVIFLIVILSFLSKKVKNAIFKDDKYDLYIQKAYLAIQQLSLECQEVLQENCNKQLDNKNLSVWIIKSMQLSVEKCYEFFCNSFESGISLIDKIKFEVTFMTKSYKDNKITIPCSCNKERRTPISMLMRENSEGDIYDKTVTAEIYKEYEEHRKPTFKIIEDTSKNYDFIYDNQKDRIKSSIVLPILSHKSELLGTLVVHCDSIGFFKEKQRDFWYEIMQLFASEIGKYKLLLDYLEKGDDLPF